MTTSIHDILAELRSYSYDERDKGDRFERLMVAYLQTDPTYQQLYSDVWMWSDYPERNGRKDTGIDLVAKGRDNGALTAIQCKFYAPNHPLNKPDIDSFLSASSKAEFSGRMIISTTDNWGKNAEEAVENQNPPVVRLRVQDLDDSPIDWSQFSLAQPGVMTTKTAKTPFPHQEKAIAKVVEGFKTADRGKLIMACGTGKTFTSLKLTEQMVPKGGLVLFLVPSIALLSQTLKEWTNETPNATENLRSFAVCSDVSVGKRKSDEDIPITDLAYPATTNTKKLMEKLAEVPLSFDGITVLFSTYQSIDVVARAQQEGLPEFDLIVCDEAHRTTGVTLADDDESAFVRVHSQAYIKAKKRLYMTATPRLYTDTSRSKAEEVGAVLTDMSDTSIYGEEFHRLGFGEAVSIGRLTDYKVLVLAVDENYISNRFQRMLADDDNEMKLEDAAKIVGCWNGLSKRALTPEEFALDPAPMKRAVAFAKNIRESKKIAEMFQTVVESEIDALDEDSGDLLHTQVHHVDGTYNVLQRNKELDWLKEEPGENNARILTNAKCLSEGVDVPALDAVMFLNPRESVVDVVQSVGRVMRKLEGKRYGYVILPIAVPGDVEPEVALADNQKYKVVWQVLQALRAHDERFDAMVNKIDLTKNTEDKLSVIGVGGKKTDEEQQDWGAVQLDFPNIGEWRDAILSKIVQKVGERRYWENWAKDVAGIASDHMTRIRTLVDGSDAKLREEFTTFTEGLQDNLNPFITEDDAIEMLSQHLITKPVFDALFEGYAFSESNPVSRVMQVMIDALEGENLEKETEQLDGFYASVRTRAAGITDAAAKQSIVKELYEKFFKTAFAGTSDRLGIVYTPNEIVDFILASTDDVLRDEFSSGLSQDGVHILDPFTGTGTFLVRLLQSKLIHDSDLLRKYRHELHANELVLLAYYVAAINIEETFHSRHGGEYQPFDGIVLTDSFQMNEDDDNDEIEGMAVFPENNDRVLAQKAQPITVVVSNPPYSIGQSSENDDSKNLKYPHLDKSIETTYAALSTSGLKRTLYDSYIRAIRWASNRIGERGVIGFVSNGSFIDARSSDGLRKSLAAEFSSLYVFNLRGNQRSSGETSRREGGKIFGSGSRATIAILLLVKNPEASKRGQIFYSEVEDFLSREDKLELVRTKNSIRNIDWEVLVPNDEGDWINQRNANFLSLTPLVARSDDPLSGILKSSSFGLVSARDSWVYGFSRTSVEANMKSTIEFYNEQIEKAASQPSDGEPVIDNSSTRISWTRSLKSDLKKKKVASFDASQMVQASYRPFAKSWLYFDRQFNEMVSKMPRMFPADGRANFGFYITGVGASKPFSVLAVRDLPDMNFWGSEGGHFFARYTFAEADAQPDLLEQLEEVGSGGGRVDNVTDEALVSFRSRYGSAVSKDDVFFYAYGLLHSPEYRQTFEYDLKKVLPRLPLVANFYAFSNAGRALSELHLNYEAVEPYPLQVSGSNLEDVRVVKMRYPGVGAKKDKSVVVVNSSISVSGIPLEAHEYLLGTKSAIDWIIERYQVKTDKPSGIINDPNDWADESGNPRYILDLLARVVTVSVETMKIVKALPPLEVIEA